MVFRNYQEDPTKFEINIITIGCKTENVSDMTEYLNKITAKKLGHFAIQMLIFTTTRPLLFCLTLLIPKAVVGVSLFVNQMVY